MPFSLSNTLISSKNAATGQNWLWLAKIEISGKSTTYIVNNNADITFDGNTYTAFPFHIKDISETSKSEAPNLQILVGNANRTIQALVEDIQGGTGGTVTLYLVDPSNLSETDVPSYKFTILKSVLKADWATFNLGGVNPFRRKAPKHKMYRNYCRFKAPDETKYGFKGLLCGYDGVETSCDRTLARCRELNNSNRFGGAPGVGKDRYFHT